jgi:ribosomal-protein-serine acetyltransferase
MFRHIIEPGLEMRLYEERFVEEVFAAIDANRDHLRRFLPWVDKTKSIDDTKTFFFESRLKFANNNGFEAGVWENNHYVGGLGFHFIRWERRFTEIGYWLAADAQGRGIMTKACTAMINHAFDTWKLNKVEIRCDPENARSRAIPERLGFKQEGILRQVLTGGDGQLHESVVYGILADEWAARKTQSSATVVAGRR